ncbi:MAG: trypsin-like peptidase domain-containing protein [Dehalococcoidales bacterium]|jgi:serine protease Do
MKRLPLKSLLVILVVVLLFGALAGASCITFSNSDTTTPAASTTATTAPPATTPSPSTTWTPPSSNGSSFGQLANIADVVAAVKPSVVAINTEVVSYDFFNRPYTQQGAGSGWIIDADGIIVTNNHVVEDAKTITVTLDDGTTYTAATNAVFTDPLNDLAIIKLDAHNLPALRIGSSGAMRIGDWVIAIGNALGQGIRATEGIISQKGVALQVDLDQTLYNLIETSAAINPGNSGGPLVNLSGEVVGITSAKIASVGVESMGYAISIDTALPIIQELVNKGYITRPWLGVRLYTVDQLAIIQLDLSVDKGAVIIQVVANGPIDNAGLREGDVIVEMDGQEVNNVEDYTLILNSSKIGEPLEIKYRRGNAEHTVTVIPEESPQTTTS